MLSEMLTYLNILSFKIAPIFYKLLFMSIGAIIVGSIILLIRRFADNRISPIWKYLMWMLVVIALVVPYRPNFNYSAIGNTSNIEKVSFREEYDNISYKVFLADQDQNVSNEEVNQLAKKQESLFAKSFIFDFAIPLIWFFVMMLFIAFLIVNRLLLMKSINSSLLPINEDYDKIHRIFTNCKEKLDVKADISIVIQSKYNFPAITGAINPVIILPSYIYEMSDESAANIIYHELSHYKRGDMYVNGALLLLQAIYWFNPLVWLLFKYIREDMEVLTDSYVIDNIDSLNSKCYLSSLVEVLGRANRIKMMPRMLCMVDGKKNTKRRIEMIKLGEKFKKKRIIISVVSIVILIVLSVLFLTKATRHEINVYLSSDKDLTNSSESLEGINPDVNSEVIKAYNKDYNMLFLNREVPYLNLKSYAITVDGEVVSKGSSDSIRISVDGIVLDFADKSGEEKFEKALSDMGLNTSKVFNLGVLDGKEYTLDAKKLWSYKVDDLSSKENLEKLVSYISFPNGVKYESYSINGDKVIIKLDAKPKVSKYYLKQSNQENFRQNGFLLLSLVKDINSVEFVLSNNKPIICADKPVSPESFAEFYRINSKEVWSFVKNHGYQNSRVMLYVWKNDDQTTYSMLWGEINRNSKDEIYDENNYTIDIDVVKEFLREYADEGRITVAQTDKGDFSEEELLKITDSFLSDKKLKIKDIEVTSAKIVLGH